MAEKGESPKPFESEVALSVARRHLEFRPSESFLEKQKTAKVAETELVAKERKAKLHEQIDLLALRVQAAASPDQGKTSEMPTDDESGCLNDEERKAYRETIDQTVNAEGTTPEDHEALRLTMTEVVFKPKVFKVHYVEWKAQWEANPALKAKFPDVKDYVLDRAKLFIQARRDEIIAARLRKFQKDALPKTGSKDEQEGRLAEISKKAVKFIHDNEDALLEYSGLDEKDPKREVLFKKFILESGLQGSDVVMARQLFQDIINDVEVAFTAQKKFEARNDRMVTRTQKSIDNNEEIDEEEWNKMLDEDLKKDKFFKEVMKQQQVVNAQPSGVGDTAPKGGSLDTVQSVALQAGGLQIMGYDPKTDSYTLRYPDSGFVTTMKIIPHPELDDPKGPKNLDHAEFVFYDKFADRDKANQVKLNAKNIRSGCNQMFLDYLMNDWIGQNKTSPDFDANSILKDASMVRMAEHLMGRSLNDIVLTKNMRGMFVRFFEIMLKGDETSTDYGNLGSFDARVRKMDLVLNDPVKAKLIYKEMESVGASVYTVSTLLKKVGYKE